MTNEEFIHINREADIRSLALRRMPEGVDALWCMQQIEGYQLAKKKLPHWAETEGIWFPPRLSMEQCSSESTAQYKADIIHRLFGNDDLHKIYTINHNPYTINEKPSLADLTGGFGVDFSYMARGAQEAYYIEQEEVLCHAAEHNMPLLGLPDVHIIHGDSTQLPLDRHFDIIFLDPARRDSAGKKTVAIEDCTPDLTGSWSPLQGESEGALQDILLSHSTYVIVKLSPMLDITQALRSLHHVSEVHVISVKGECKELLFVLTCQEPHDITTYCVNLDTHDAPFHVIGSGKSNDNLHSAPSTLHLKDITFGTPARGMLLFEPNASIMKAGLQDAFGAHFRLQKLHPMSNLYISRDIPATDDIPASDTISTLPARTFHICDIYDFSKYEQKRLCANLKSANITVRNFPSTVADLRKRLKIKEGGPDYLFFTTIQESSRHVILHCRKV